MSTTAVSPPTAMTRRAISTAICSSSALSTRPRSAAARWRTPPVWPPWFSPPRAWSPTSRRRIPRCPQPPTWAACTKPGGQLQKATLQQTDAETRIGLFLLKYYLLIISINILRSSPWKVSSACGNCATVSL